ncbi:MAG: MFS transporter [Planctomycetota bacterium]|nr:MFS transporter [Planctomycetota bacterium]
MNDDPATTSPAQPRAGALRRLLLLRPGEGSLLASTLLAGFLVHAAYYILRPIRDSFAISAGTERLPWMITGTLAAVLLGNLLYSFAAGRLTRGRLIPGVYRFFAVNILAFYALFLALPEASAHTLGLGFFVWTGVFNLFAVSIFWGLISESFDHERAVRLFGAVAAGGTLGAVFGAGAVTTLALWLGPIHLLPLGAIMIEGAIHALRSSDHAAERLRLAAPTASDAPTTLTTTAASTDAPAPTPHPIEDAPVRTGRLNGLLKGLVGGSTRGLRDCAREPYLRSIALYMMLFTVTSTIAYFEQTRLVGLHVQDHAGRVAMLARIDLVANIATLILQFLVTGRLVRRIGVAWALLLVPALTAAGFGMLYALPTLGALIAFQVARRSVHYAVDRPTREMLFTVVPAERRLASKAFIDTFIYRGGDLIGAWGYGLMGSATSGAASLMSLIGVPVALAWLAGAAGLGRRHERLRRASSGHQTAE